MLLDVKSFDTLILPSVKHTIKIGLRNIIVICETSSRQEHHDNFAYSLFVKEFAVFCLICDPSACANASKVWCDACIKLAHLENRLCTNIMESTMFCTLCFSLSLYIICNLNMKYYIQIINILL